MCRERNRNNEGDSTRQRGQRTTERCEERRQRKNEERQEQGQGSRVTDGKTETETQREDASEKTTDRRRGTDRGGPAQEEECRQRGSTASRRPGVRMGTSLAAGTWNRARMQRHPRGSDQPCGVAGRPWMGAPRLGRCPRLEDVASSRPQVTCGVPSIEAVPPEQGGAL